MMCHTTQKIMFIALEEPPVPTEKDKPSHSSPPKTGNTFLKLSGLLKKKSPSLTCLKDVERSQTWAKTP